MSAADRSLAHTAAQRQTGRSRTAAPTPGTGDLRSLQELVKLEGVGALGQYDEKGCTPAHWAALNGSATLLTYLVDCKAPVNLPCRSEPGQRPIHWAAVSGYLGVMDILLEAGVWLDERDHRGCTALIIAAQYGHITLCCYLMGKGASLQMCDHEGDSALHWAAFHGLGRADFSQCANLFHSDSMFMSRVKKFTVLFSSMSNLCSVAGHCELTRLLIYSGFDPRQPDAFGQIPLHLAVLSGDFLTVQVLCDQDGIALETEDINGNIPLKLARSRQNKDIVMHLEKTIGQSNSLIPRFDWSALIFGPPEKSKGPVLFFYGCILLWGYPSYFTRIVSISLDKLLGFHITFLIGNALMWYLFLKASLMDPGFLLRDSEEYYRAIRQAVYFDHWKRGQNPLSRLCHVCQLVKPLRSKHCRVTNRCVDYFDHYCPYIYNDVGCRNRTHFFGFLATVCLNSVMGIYFCCDWFNVMGRSIFIGIGFIFLSVVAVISAMMTCVCLYMAAINLTTNERMNQEKYSYLHDENAQFRNPFNRGVKLNLLEFFHLIEPQKEDKVMTLEELCII